MSRILVATAMGVSLVGAQALPIPLLEQGNIRVPVLQLAHAEEDSCSLTLVHGGTSTAYTSFSEALAAAQDGDTLELEEDAEITSTVQTDKALTLDLKGHTLTGSLGAGGKSGALSFGGSGTFTLTSSDGSGTLEVTVGSPSETSSSAGSYRAVSVTGGGAFVLDGTSVSATYTGSSTASNLPTPAVYGIAVDSGSLTLQNGASATATASEEDDTYGANEVAGVYLASTDSNAKVSISADSSVSAVNNAESTPRGSWQTPDTTASNTTYDSSHLVQIFPDEDSEFYKEICAKFKKYASFDDAEEAAVTSSNSNDTEIYYIAPITLDSGVAVWAYSDPQDNNEKGELDNIVPKYFFVQADYVVMAKAYGISSSSSFAGSVEVQGTVSAACKNGDAYAFNALGSSTWTASQDAQLSETCGEEAQRVEYGLLNLESYIDPTSSTTISALGNTSGRVVYSKTPAKGSALVGSSAQVTVDGQAQSATDTSVDLKADGIQVDDEVATDLWKTSDVSINFANVRSSDGTASESAASTKATFAKTLEDSNITLPSTAESYTEDGTTYRFTGWRVGSSTYTAEALQNDVLVNSDLNSATKGSVTFTAAYTPVSSGQYLVQFVVDGQVLAYAADAGSTPSYTTAGGSDSTPDKINEEDGYEYEFEGWQQNGETLTELPAVSGDATYTASFKATPEEEELIFRYRGSDGSWTTTSGVTAAYGSDTNTIAQQYAKAGDVIKTSDEVYTFEGWGPRVTDTEALYADGELPTVRSTDSFSRLKNRYFAKYTSAERMLNVTFVVDGEVYAQTSEAIAASTDFDDVLEACGVSNPSDKSKKKRFLGWSTTEGSTTVDIAKTNAATLSVVSPEESDDVTLYAVFGSSSSASSAVTRTDISVKLDKTAKKEISVDASRLYITAANLDNATDLQLSISATGNVDSTISGNVSRMGYEALVSTTKRKSIYEAHLTYKLDGTTHEVYDSFGKIKITAKIPSGARSDKTRAFWLASSGINYTAVTQNKSSITFSIRSLGYVDDGVGNIELALTSASSASIISVAPSSITPATPSAASPSVPSVSTSTPSASKPSTSTSTPTASTDSTDSGSGTDDSGDSSESTPDTNQTGNVIGFAAMLALLAALAARVVWFFVKRRKGDVEEDEEDPLPDKETVTF